MDIRLLTISAGRIVPLFVRDGQERVSSVMSAIRKSPVSTLDLPTAIDVGTLCVAGDESADMSVHGGRDKAVYFMPVEHYPFWADQRQRARLGDEPMPHGFLGENFTISGLLEADIYIGDELTLGDLRLRVTQPREPCFKFNARMGYTHAAKHMVQQGNCGWYASVVTPGAIKAGDRIDIHPGPRRLSVAQKFSDLNRKVQKSLF